MIAPLAPRGPSVVDRLEAAWARSDALFDLLRDEAWHARPIPLRHPFVFYLGHLPAFAWNLVADLTGRGPIDARLDRLFAFGIDPLESDAAEQATIDAWPALERIVAYRDEVRDALRAAWPDVARESDQPLAQEGRVVHMVLEHELMHHETLLYLLYALDPDLLVRPRDVALETGGPPPDERVLVPGGPVELGADFHEVPFAWDNELPRRSVEVGAFQLDRHPTTVDAWREFLDARGYERRELWTAADWEWLRAEGRAHPAPWALRDGTWHHRHLFGWVPLDEVGGWPALVSYAEAAAFARWRGGRIAREPELMRAALGDADGPHPWGAAAPSARHGNFDFRSLDPIPVGARPAGASHYGVEELVGNGWEWTSTEFTAHEGFRNWHPSYAGYSQDFFSDGHRVLFGGSWATDATLLRPSFRNWFQPRYPWVFAKVRLAWAS